MVLKIYFNSEVSEVEARIQIGKVFINQEIFAGSKEVHIRISHHEKLEPRQAVEKALTIPEVQRADIVSVMENRVVLFDNASTESVPFLVDVQNHLMKSGRKIGFTVVRQNGHELHPRDVVIGCACKQLVVKTADKPTVIVPLNGDGYIKSIAEVANFLDKHFGGTHSCFNLGW